MGEGVVGLSWLSIWVWFALVCFLSLPFRRFPTALVFFVGSGMVELMARSRPFLARDAYLLLFLFVLLLSAHWLHEYLARHKVSGLLAKVGRKQWSSAYQQGREYVTQAGVSYSVVKSLALLACLPLMYILFLFGLYWLNFRLTVVVLFLFLPFVVRVSYFYAILLLVRREIDKHESKEACRAIAIVSTRYELTRYLVASILVVLCMAVWYFVVYAMGGEAWKPFGSYWFLA